MCYDFSVMSEVGIDMLRVNIVISPADMVRKCDYPYEQVWLCDI